MLNLDHLLTSWQFSVQQLMMSVVSIVFLDYYCTLSVNRDSSVVVEIQGAVFGLLRSLK